MTDTTVELAAARADVHRFRGALARTEVDGEWAWKLRMQLAAAERWVGRLDEASEGVADASENDLVGGHAQVGTPSLASSTQTTASARGSLDGSARAGA